MEVIFREVSTVIEKISDRFSIIEKLGEGSDGEVLKCYDKKEKMIVALKKLKKISPFETNQVLNEIKILKGINHPNIVKLYDVIITRKPRFELYFVQEYSQEALYSIIRYISHDEKILISFMYQILVVLNYLHENHILHRDIKPENIFIQNGKVIKIGDFGFSTKNESSNELVGTIEYIAPEVLQHKIYTNKVDIYSFGVVLYELAFGFVPFHKNTQEETIKAIINDNETYPKDSNESLVSLCKQLLQKDPAKRPYIESIKQSTFYSSIEWNKISQKEVKINVNFNHSKSPVKK